MVGFDHWRGEKERKGLRGMEVEGFGLLFVLISYIRLIDYINCLNLCY